MTETWLIAYVVMPLIIGVGAYVAVRLHERASRRQHRTHSHG